MSDLVISTAHRAARNAATIAHADAGAGPSCIKLFAAEGGVLIGVRTLDKPCGQLNAQGQIVLQASASNDLVQASGNATFATWHNGNGVVIAQGAVTDEAGDGPFKLGGTSGTALYEGGLVLLGMTVIG